MFLFFTLSASSPKALCWVRLQFLSCGQSVDNYKMLLHAQCLRCCAVLCGLDKSTDFEAKGVRCILLSVKGCLSWKACTNFWRLQAENLIAGSLTAKPLVSGITNVN